MFWLDIKTLRGSLNPLMYKWCSQKENIKNIGEEKKTLNPPNILWHCKRANMNL